MTPTPAGDRSSARPLVIHDADVRAALERLPPDCWLRSYVKFGESQISSPLAYHVAVGLALQAATAPQDLCGMGFSRPVRPNFWSLLVGSSGGGKTTAIELGMDMLRAAAPDRIGADATSDEALMLALAARPTQIISYPEGARLLALCHDPRGQGKTAAMDDFFDGNETYSRVYTRRQPVEVHRPRLSLLVGCTPRHLESMTTLVDWEGGFISRLFIVQSEPERRVPCPMPMSGWRDALTGWLSYWAGQPARTLHLSPDGRERWVAWSEATKERSGTVDPRIAGAINRGGLVVSKTSLLVAWSMGSPEITGAHVEAGIALEELHRRSLLALSEGIAESPEHREQIAVYHAIGADWTPLGAICGLAKLSLRRTKIHIETLMERGLIAHDQQGTTNYYRCVPGGAPPAYDPGLQLVMPPAPPR